MAEEYNTGERGTSRRLRGGTTLLDLPDELLLRICAELPPSPAHLVRVARVCRRLHAVASEQVLWAALFDATPGFALTADARARAVATTEAPGHWDADGDWVPAGRKSQAGSLLSPATWLRYAYELLWPSALPRPGAHAVDDAIPVHYPTLYRSRCVVGDEMMAQGPHNVYDGFTGDDSDAPRAMSSDVVVAPNHLWRLHKHTAKVYAVRVRGQWAATGSRDRTVKIWRMATFSLDGEKLLYGPEVVHTAEAHAGSVLSLDFEVHDGVARNGRGFMVTGSSDMAAKAWAIDWGDGDGKGVDAHVLCTLEGAGDRVAAVAFGHDYIVVGFQLTPVYDRASVYVCDSTEPLRVVESSPVCGIAVHPGGLDRALVASTEGRWMIVDLASGEQLQRGGEGDEAFGCVTWKDDYIICGCEGGKTAVYSASSGTRIRTLHSPKKRLVRAVVADVDAGIVLTAGHDGQVHFTRLDGSDTYRSYDFGGTPIFGMHRDGMHLVAGLGDGTAALVTYGNGLPYAGLFA